VTWDRTARHGSAADDGVREKQNALEYNGYGSHGFDPPRLSKMLREWWIGFGWGVFSGIVSIMLPSMIVLIWAVWTAQDVEN
jgi:hypothetical protein